MGSLGTFGNKGSGPHLTFATLRPFVLFYSLEHNSLVPRTKINHKCPFADDCNKK